ncbi:putative uncharacterized oxidoreductase [Hypsibius exemplaris]|uniref:Uncharacterized oxidoreductase n=1 Tax=Hypsibius exemplaris TaxID=2072580 RepID=A0A1W0WB52_HYPEX|nr:putative uncharacterized oxidoreductase [Hypsibius exemplaris]
MDVCLEDAAATRVLVTGASGFLASHICQQLQERGYRVRGTVRSLKDLKKVAPLRKLCPVANYQLDLVEADLLHAKDWMAAVAGCTYVIHVASPVPGKEPSDEQTLIQPAVKGTLNVLKACRDAGCVKRVVITSSAYAIVGQTSPRYDKVYSESDWTDMNAPVGAYAKSKTLAERAAWDFVRDLPEANKFEVAVINPTYIMGPVIHGSSGASQMILLKLMKREISALPNISLEVCDVRDVAQAHIKAMILDAAVGKRFIINTGVLWFRECAEILRREFTQQGYKIPSTNAHKIVVWAAAKFDKALLMLLPRWGKELRFNSDRMLNVLDIQPRNMEDTILDMAYTMIEGGFLPKAPNYRKRKAPLSRQVSQQQPAEH